jgi:hypothetical protein
LTGQQVITQALTTLGIVPQGGAPSASDSADALIELNNLWAGAGIDNGLIFAVQPATVSTTANGGTYLWSAFSTAAPPSIVYSANWKAGAGQRFSLKLISSEAYWAHRDLAAAALAPDELYADFLQPAATGPGSVFLWPVPSVVGVLDVEVGVIFGTWALASQYNAPQGYLDYVNYALAARLIPRFGEIVSAEAQQTIEARLLKAEARLRDMNLQNRRLELPASANPAQIQAAATQQRGQ